MGWRYAVNKGLLRKISSIHRLRFSRNSYYKKHSFKLLLVQRATFLALRLFQADCLDRHTPGTPRTDLRCQPPSQRRQHIKRIIRTRLRAVKVLKQSSLALQF